MTKKLIESTDGQQQWEDDEFCDAYEATWEISVEQVHYGWLAEGEDELELLNGLKLSGANVLDIGCGLGQNLIALAKKGANCVGLDISPCMLSKAECLVEDEGVAHKVKLVEGDMRELSGLVEGEYDLILSVYSMEYLSGVQELKTVVHDIHKRLKPGGLFVMCFTHPSQAHRYPELMNCSVPIGAGKYRTYNYSVRDATDALFKSNFSVERIVEQITKTPSSISYEKGCEYPYHFRESCNPCSAEYDEISNGSPHTIIYKSRRQHDARKGYFDRQISLDVGFREIWGVKRKIVKHTKISYLGYGFDSLELAPRDNVSGLVDVLNATVTTEEASELKGEIVELHVTNADVVSVPAGSVLGVIHRRLIRLGLEPVYQSYLVDTPDSDRKKEERVLLVGVVGLDDLVRAEFETEKIGLLTFLDGDEPAKGELPIDDITAVPGEKISLIYVALKERTSKEVTPQMKFDL